VITLYHHQTSVCAAKSRLALDEKGVAWDGQLIRLRASEQHKAEYRALNPFGQVPVLIHNEKVIADSNVINEYVDEAFDGPRLSPATPEGRARMRFWTRQLDDSIHPALGVLMTAVAYRHQDGHREQITRQVDPFKKNRKTRSVEDGIDTPHLRMALQRFDLLLDHIEEALGGNGPGRACAGGGPDWLAGDYSLADLDLTPYITRLDLLGLGAMWDRRPRVAGWLERLKARPSHRRAITDWYGVDPGWLPLLRETSAEARPALLAMIEV